jgi:hypothetical protein
MRDCEGKKEVRKLPAVAATKLPVHYERIIRIEFERS